MKFIFTEIPKDFSEVLLLAQYCPIPVPVTWMRKSKAYHVCTCSWRIGRNKQHGDPQDYLVGPLERRRRRGKTKISQTQIGKVHGEGKTRGCAELQSGPSPWTLGPFLRGGRGHLRGHSGRGRPDWGRLRNRGEGPCRTWSREEKAKVCSVTCKHRLLITGLGHGLALIIASRKIKGSYPKDRSGGFGVRQLWVWILTLSLTRELLNLWSQFSHL